MHMSFFKRWLQLSTLLLIIISVTGIQAHAESDQSDEQQRLRQLRAHINTAKKTIRKTQSQEQSAALKLETIEQKYAQTSRNLQALASQASQLQKQLKHISDQKIQQQTILESRQKHLKDQLRAAYQSGRQGQWRLILSQVDPSKMARHLVYYQHMNQLRLSQINVLHSLITEIEETEASKILINQALTEKQHTIELEQQKLAKTRKKRTVILAKLKHQVKHQKNNLATLLKHEKQLQQLIGSISQSVEDLDLTVINKQPFSRLKGKLAWPLENHGAYYRHKTNGKSKGIFIKTSEGAQVRAVAHGRIVFSDWMPGYGLLVIIDHGANYLSLYAYNQNLTIALGNKVNAGEIIASAGASGGRSETALYFEIRKKKHQENPLRWLRKK
jgi:septal ring factor EnvC (AmiA/AmiB activator)